MDAIPDVRRALSAAELAELEELLVRGRPSRFVAIWAALIDLLVLVGIALTLGAANGPKWLPPTLLCIFCAILNHGRILPSRRRWQLLREDVDDGQVRITRPRNLPPDEPGELELLPRSGLLWTIDHQPARWRTTDPPMGTD